MSASVPTEPKLTIITISFNQREFLEHCVRSVNAANDNRIEHIVVDPGSTDGSREWLNAASQSLRLIFEPDDGPADGLNKGLSAAHGSIIMYLNADDELAPGAVDAVLQFHDRRPDVEVLLSSGWTIDQFDRPIQYISSDRVSPFRYAANVLTVLQQGTSFKRRVFESGLRFNRENRISWDAELNLDAFARGYRFAYDSTPVGYFRLQPASLTMSGRMRAAYIRENQRLRRRVGGRFLQVAARLFEPGARTWKKAFSVVSNRNKVFPGVVCEVGVTATARSEQ